MPEAVVVVVDLPLLTQVALEDPVWVVEVKTVTTPVLVLLMESGTQDQAVAVAPTVLAAHK
jgi:hypothetical protein